MPGKVVLLTGVPASGKTTLARKLAETVSPLDVIHFGELILEAMKPKVPTATEKDLRARPSEMVSLPSLQGARARLLERIRKSRGTTNLLIDSHAVAVDDYGFRITPDDHLFLKEMSLDAVLVLHVSHAEIAARIRERPEGRREATSNDVAVHEALQDAVAISYGVSTGSPVFVVKAGRSLDETVERILKVLTLTGMDFSRKGG